MFWRLLFGSIVRQADGLGGGGGAGPDLDALPGAPPLDLANVLPSEPGATPDDGMGERTPAPDAPGVSANQLPLGDESGARLEVLDDGSIDELGLDLPGGEPTGEPRPAPETQPEPGESKAVYRTANGADVTGEDVEALMIRQAALERELDAARRPPPGEREAEQVRPESDDDEIPELKLPDDWNERTAGERADWQAQQMVQERNRQRATQAKARAEAKAVQGVERQQRAIETIREGIETGPELKFLDRYDIKALGVEPAKLRHAASVAATGMGLLRGGVTSQDTNEGDVSRRFAKQFLKEVILPVARAIALSKGKAGARPPTAGGGGGTHLPRRRGGMRMPINPTPADDRAMMARARETAQAQRASEGID